MGLQPERHIQPRAGAVKRYSSGYGGTMATSTTPAAAAAGRWVNGELYIGDVVPQPVRSQVQ